MKSKNDNCILFYVANGQTVARGDGRTFTQMIMSSYGGMGPEMVVALKHLAQLIAVKRDEEYSQVLRDLRAMCTFEDENGFDLLEWFSQSSEAGRVANHTEELAVAMAELRL